MGGTKYMHMGVDKTGLIIFSERGDRGSFRGWAAVVCFA